MSSIGPIDELSSAEHARVLNADVRYGGFYINAHNVTLLLSNLVMWPLDADASTFLFFYSQVKKFHTLSLLSTIRMHRIQAKLNLRYFLESTVHSVFGLANLDPDICFDFENQKLRPTQRVMDRANKWLAQNFEPGSTFIKNLKQEINEQTAHSNVGSTGHNFNIAPGDRPEIHTPFFDFEDDHQVKADLWICAKAGLEAINLILAVRNVHGHFVDKADRDEIRGYMCESASKSDPTRRRLTGLIF